MMKGPPDREPDVETSHFKLWELMGDKSGHPALLTIDASEGEELHEFRVYGRSVVPGYELLILSKKKGERYWHAAKGKRPDGTTFVTTGLTGPLTLEGYNRELSRIENAFSGLFDTENPQITPGRHVMTYLRRPSTKK